MDPLTIIVVCTGLIAYSLMSHRLQFTGLSLPIFFSSFGLLLGDLGIGLIDMKTDTDLLAVFAEVALVLVLFSDAAQVELRALRDNLRAPAMMLFIGMPLTILFGTAVAHWASPQAPLALALLVAAILTPTDASLSQSILSSKSVPLSIRQSINIESGLNDGIVVPVVMLAAILSAQATGTDFHDAPDNLPLFVFKQLVFGPVVGIGLGYLLGTLIDRGVASGKTDNTGQAIAVLAGALMSFTAAEAIGGNGFIAAFLAGLTVGNVMSVNRTYTFEFMESEGKVLTMLTFVIFGAVLLPKGIEHADPMAVAVACLFLSLVRMLPIVISLIGVKLPFRHKLAMGWFGPRGLASILFALLIDERFNITGFESVLSCVVLTVAISIVVHGITASIIVGLFERSQASNTG